MSMGRASRLLLRAVGAVVVTSALAGAPMPALASNDTYFDQQWNLAQIGAPAAWQQSTGKGID